MTYEVAASSRKYAMAATARLFAATAVMRRFTVTEGVSLTLPTPFVKLNMTSTSGGLWLDTSGNALHAQAVTINTTNDGIKLADDDTLRDYVRRAGLYELFYDSDDAPLAVLLRRLGRLYNNVLFFNDDLFVFYADPLLGDELALACHILFGEYDADALAVIAASGVTKTIQKRLIDTHIKDLKALNALQADLFVFGNPATSTIKQLHPMVGETFGAVKYNWLLPQDTDAAHRLTLADGAAVRMLQNCINFDSTFALDTHFNAATELDTKNSFSYYSIFNFPDAYINRYLSPILYDEERYELGALGVAGGNKGIAMAVQCDNVQHAICENPYQSPSKGVQYTETDAMAFYLTNKTAAGDLRQWRQGVQVGATVSDSGAGNFYNGNIILGGYAIDGVIQSAKRSVLPCGYYHMGGAITPAALDAFNDAVLRLCSAKNYYYYPPDETAKATLAHAMYVSATGSDITGDGSQVNPLATLAKASTLLQDGTTLYLERGSVFYGDVLDLTGRNNIVVDAYGVGAAPVLDGLKAVVGWTDMGGNIWSHQDATLPAEITNLFIGGYKAVLGRLPETSYKTATNAVASETQLTDSTRTEPDGYWDGCEVVIRYYDWATGISRCSAYAAKTFTIPPYHGSLTVGNRYKVSNGTQYFLQNHIACINAQGEWCYNHLTKTISIYSTAEPAGVTASYGTDAIIVKNAKHIKLQNIDVYGSQRCGVNIESSSDVQINAVQFDWSGMYSILAQYTNLLRITNVVGLNQNTDFCNILWCDNVQVEDCVALYCGVDQGACRYITDVFPLGGSGGMTGHMINNLVVRHNHSAYTAYSAITFNYGTKFLLEKNWTHHFNLNKYDGGGVSCNTATYWHLPAYDVYPMTTGRMNKNIITDGNLPENSYGLYVDNYTERFETYKNFAAGCRWNIILHESIRNYCHHNAAVQENGSEAGMSYGMTLPTTIRALIEHNLYVNPQTDAPAFFSISKATNINTIRNNRHYFPLGKVGTGSNKSINQLGSTWYDLAEWLADETRADWDRAGEQEIIPVVTPDLLPRSEMVIYITNPAKTTKTVTAADVPFNDYMTLDGVYAQFPFTIEPYGWVILMRAPAPEYYDAAIDGGNAKQILIRATVYLNPASAPSPSDFAITGKTIDAVSVASNVITLHTIEDNAEADNLAITYTQPAVGRITALYGGLAMASFTGSANMVKLTLAANGTGAGVATLRIRVRGSVTITLDGAARFYDDVGGTLNEGTSRTVTQAMSLTSLYMKCPSGTANMKFSDADGIYQFYTWTSGTNAPFIGGSLDPFHKLENITFAGNNTLTGDIDKHRDCEIFAIYSNNAMYGTTANLTRCYTFDVRSAAITYNFARMRKLANILINSLKTLSSAEVNQMLADVWANRDNWRYSYSTTRSIDIRANVASGAPTGQGIIDKTNLLHYRTPHNNTRYAVWTILTR